MGGYIYSNEKNALGFITDINQKPSFWVCADCKNSWKIPPSVYDTIIMARE